MSFNPDDISIAIKLLLDTTDAVNGVNNFATRLKALEKAMLRINAINAANGQKPVFTQQQINSVNNLNNGLNQTAPAASKAGKGLWSLTNLARTALGTFEAMAIFLVTKFVGDAVSKSISSIKQLELALYNLAVAERTLSNLGVDITPEDFQEIIKSVKDLGLAISDTDITKGVADLATGLQDLGLSKEQLKGLSEAAAVIAMAEGLTMENVVSQFSQGIAKGGRGLADLDIQVDAAIIKQKALEEGLVSSEDAWNNLTAAQKQTIETQALYLIILDSAKTKMEEMSLLQDSVTTSTKETSAAWENFTTTLGSTFKPVIVQASNALTLLLEILQKSVAGLGILFAVYVSGIASMASVNKQFWASLRNGDLMSFGERLSTFMDSFKIGFNSMMSQMFPTGVPGMETNTFLPKSADTPTAQPKVSSDIAEEQADLQKALDKMNNEILEAQIKLAQDMEDAQIDLGRKLVDIAEEYARKRADAERDYANRVNDINSSYRQKITDIRNDEAEANAKARNDELEREAEFQNKMLELKENYLMDLEEALHERDARQVLRLMKQYNLDKAQAERENALDRQSAARDLQEKKRQFARERADAENERKTKLAQAARDYQDKLAQLKADEEAERRAAQIAYERKMQDLNREMHNRLSLVAAGLVQEFKLTKSGLDAIYALYKMYFGAITGVYSAMNTMLAGQSMTLAMNQLYTTNPSSSGGGRSTTTKAFAEGGMMIADRPTTVTFGEGGTPELAQFTPIGKNGRDVNKLFSNLGSAGSSGGSGALEIDLTLSPDLEARVIKKSADNVANVITRVQRSKVR